MNTSSSPRKKSTVRHTRAIARDRMTRSSVAPPAPEVEQRLTELIHPATFEQMAHYQRLGLRQRTLTLPVMVAFVLSLLWRQMGAVSEAVRVLQREGMLWSGKVAVSQQAMSERLRAFPHPLFEGVLTSVLPVMQARWRQRKRPVPLCVAWGLRHFDHIQAVDGSTLDALLKKVGLLRDTPGTPLGGRMLAILDIVSRLPQHILFEENSKAHDQSFWDAIFACLQPKTLLLFDLGFLNFACFDRLCEKGVGFITRAKSNTVCSVVTPLRDTRTLKESVVRVGSGKTACAHVLRLVEVWHQGQWYRYLTNVTEPQVLPAEVVAALYWQRWRIEDAFFVVKRLLGLAYFYVGSVNGVQTQVWATWLLYAVLTDLCDEVAHTLDLPLACISFEMVYRGLYHYTQAYHRGETRDPIAYLCAKENADLGIVKRKRKGQSAEILELAIPPLPLTCN
jgi:hypothetical protein